MPLCCYSRTALGQKWFCRHRQNLARWGTTYYCHLLAKPKRSAETQASWQLTFSLALL